MLATVGPVKIADESGHILTCDVESYDAISKPQITLVEL
jgi:hypothetical protein